MSQAKSKKILIIGNPRSGKSSAAYALPKTIFIDCDGTSLHQRTNAKTYINTDKISIIREKIAALEINNTLVIDSIDSIIYDEPYTSESQESEKIASLLANCPQTIICTANKYVDKIEQNSLTRAIARRFSQVSMISIDKETKDLEVKQIKPVQPQAISEKRAFTLELFGFQQIIQEENLLPKNVEKNTYSELRYLIEKMREENAQIAPYNTAREFMIGERIWSIDSIDRTRNPATSPEEMRHACETARILAEELASANRSDL